MMTLDQARQLQSTLVALEYSNEIVNPECNTGCSVPVCPVCWGYKDEIPAWAGNRGHAGECPFPRALATINAEVLRLEVGAGLKGYLLPGGLRPTANANT